MCPARLRIAERWRPIAASPEPAWPLITGAPGTRQSLEPFSGTYASLAENQGSVRSSPRLPRRRLQVSTNACRRADGVGLGIENGSALGGLRECVRRTAAAA